MRKYLIAIFLSLMFCFPVYGADQKIPELTALGAKPASDDMLVIYDSFPGITKRVAYSFLEDIKNVNIYGGLTAAVATFGGTEVTLLIDDAQTVTDTLSIPTTMQLFVLRSGDITVSGSKVLTINGTILAGAYQIFSGLGTVLYNGLGIEYGAWKSGGNNTIIIDDVVVVPLYDEALSADGTYSGTTCAAVMGYDGAAFGELVYLATSDQRWELTDADAEATAGDVMLGIVITGGDDGDTGLVLLHGFVRENDWNFTSYGQALFISVTEGDMSQTAVVGDEDIHRVVGYAHDNADTIYFNPDRLWVELDI